MIELGIKIKDCRNLYGMTQQQLAKSLGVSRQALSLWEIGIREPSIDIIKKICILFDIPTDELLEMEKEKHKQESTANSNFNNNLETIRLNNKNKN